MQDKGRDSPRPKGAPLDGPEWSRDAPGADPGENLPPWEGNIRFSESGDENAEGDVSAETADYVATGGNRIRPSAEERAADWQRPLGEPSHPPPGSGDVPEARDDYGLGRPGHLSPERRETRPGASDNQEENQA